MRLEQLPERCGLLQRDCGRRRFSTFPARVLWRENSFSVTLVSDQVKKHIHAVRLYLTKGEVHTAKQGGNYPIKLLLEEIPLRLSWQQGAVEPAGMLGLATYLSVVPGGSDHRRR